MNGTQGPTSSRYCFAITRSIWARWPRSWTTQLASSWRRVTGPRPGWSPGRFEADRGQLPGREQIEIGGAEFGKLGQETIESAADVAGPMAEAVVGLEAWFGTLGENDLGTRYPIGLLTINQVTDDIERAEGVGSFDGVAPFVREVAQDRVESLRRPGENRGGLGEIELHDGRASQAG